MFFLGFVCGFAVAMLLSIAITFWLYRHQKLPPRFDSLTLSHVA